MIYNSGSSNISKRKQKQTYLTYEENMKLHAYIKEIPLGVKVSSHIYKESQHRNTESKNEYIRQHENMYTKRMTLYGAFYLSFKIKYNDYSSLCHSAPLWTSCERPEKM